MKKYFLYGGLFIVFVSIFVFLFLPRFKLNEGNITLDVYGEYNEPGYKAYNIVYDFSDKVNVESNLDTTKIGNYSIRYSYKFLNIEKFKIRNVNVVDRLSPEIKLEYEDEEICKNKINEYKYIGIDNYDGDITDKVDIKLDDNRLVYSLKDSNGNLTTVTKDIKIKQTTPTIKLKGTSTTSIYVNSEYTEAGFEATDECDGDLTDKVVIEGVVDNKKVGTYKLIYKVSNSSGVSSFVERNVNVVEKIVSSTPITNGAGNGIIYLTFDDGPSSTITPALLDILKEEGVKATFFVIDHGDSLDYLIKREYDEGHTVALHTASHKYSYIYASETNFFTDLEKIENRVIKVTGVDSKIIRFPGGSSNTVSKSYKKGIMTNLTHLVTEKGYIYFDWNVDSNDAGGASTASAVYNNVIKGLRKNKTNVVLMHDAANKKATLGALRDIIRYGKANGYTFAAITSDTPRVVHGVNN